MALLRRGRRRYYDLFAHVYDGFVGLHARGEGEATRDFLAQSAGLSEKRAEAVLDVCCGTGAVIAAMTQAHTNGLSVGCDFSRGMLRKARKRLGPHGAAFVEGDASALPFAAERFDVITCSHALYELKGGAREEALREMHRVLRKDGVVLIMEHEVPKRRLIRFLFRVRLRAMGSNDAEEFVNGGLAPFERVFPVVSLAHSPTARSRLIRCRKHPLSKAGSEVSGCLKTASHEAGS